MRCKILGLGLIMICLGRNGFARALFHLAYMRPFMLGFGMIQGLMYCYDDGWMGSKKQGKAIPIIKLGSCYEMRIMTVFTTVKLLPSIFAVM